jgi:phospholipid transport system substrate-binding protein
MSVMSMIDGDRRSRRFRRGRVRARGRFRRAICGTVFLAGAIYVAFAGSALARADAAGDAAQFVARVGQEVVNVLGAPEQAIDQRRRKFRNIFDRALDLDAMARRVLGRHWRRATDAQREQYVRLFRRYVLGIYAIQLGGYAGEKFTVLRQQSRSPAESLVIARITREFGAPLDLSFRVRLTKMGYRIVDVTVAGVSLIVTKRSEFDSIIRREGLPGLLRRLDSKSASAGRPEPGSGSLLAQTISALSSGSVLIVR